MWVDGFSVYIYIYTGFNTAVPAISDFNTVKALTLVQRVIYKTAGV